MNDETPIEKLQMQLNRLESKIDFLSNQKEPSRTPLWLCFVYGFAAVVGIFIIPMMAMVFFSFLRSMFS